MTSPLSQQSVRRTLVRAATWAAISLSLPNVVSAQILLSGDLAPFEVEYDVGNNLISAGTAILKLTQEDDSWTYSLNTKPRGVFKLAGKGRISESSQFTLLENENSLQLQPHTYTFRQDNERRRKVDATFDWSEKTITHVYRGVETTEPFEDPVIDRLTGTLLIMNALRHDFTKAVLPIYDKNKIKLVEFVNVGMDTLKTPLGEVETHRVINRNAVGSSRETTTWFAPSLDYLPIKIEHRKRGELVARLSLIRLSNRVTNIELSEESIQLGDAQPIDTNVNLDPDTDADTNSDADTSPDISTDADTSSADADANSDTNTDDVTGSDTDTRSDTSTNTETRSADTDTSNETGNVAEIAAPAVEASSNDPAQTQ